MCTHTGGVIARILEEAGLSTTSISLVREHSELIKPPRALFVPFPFGNAFGRPDDPEMQHRVLRAALDLLSEPDGPVLRDFPDDGEDSRPGAPVQASAIPLAEIQSDPAMETTRIRRYHEQWVERTGRTAVGVTGIPPTRFRGVIRFLEAYVAGQDADMPGRPADVSAPMFLRYCADDLKAMYWEARFITHPNDDDDAIARWFWGETATGALIRRVKERMDDTDDPAMKAIANGIAR